ncbi:MAG: glycerate kinase [Candidatus Baldrarchaeota archaeon]
MIKNYDKLIENGLTQKDRNARRIALDCILSALNTVNPKQAVLNNVKRRGNLLVIGRYKFALTGYRNIYVLGGGKASGLMAEAIEEILGDKITSGVINVLKGTEKMVKTKKIKINGATHPIPGEEGVNSTKAMLEIARKAGKDDLIIVLISGGGSALMPCPADPVTLEDKKIVTNLLLKCGATINEINVVRKHLSEFKGGQLAKTAYPATLVNLIISDVVGDPLDIIASGPTVPDSSTFQDAYNVLKKYNLLNKIPENIKKRIQLGLSGKIEETPKPGDKIFRNVHNILIASNRTACIAAVKKARELGINSMLLSTYIEGEARHVGAVLAGLAKEIHNYDTPIKKPAVIVCGGETTVTVVGNGKGGRNQELALGSALKISGLNGIVIASVGTDGKDGTSDAAGAIVDGQTLKRAQKLGLDTTKYLANNNSYMFFKKLGDAIFTGTTGTNVNDLITIVVL